MLFKLPNSWALAHFLLATRVTVTVLGHAVSRNRKEQLKKAQGGNCGWGISKELEEKPTGNLTQHP
jgi:hypothetical protein